MDDLVISHVLSNNKLIKLILRNVQLQNSLFFILTILVVTNDKKYSSVAGIVIGLTLVLVHLIGIGLTGTSVNPARRLGPAIVLLGTALKQVWVFIVGPIVGALVAGYLYKYLKAKSK